MCCSPGSCTGMSLRHYQVSFSGQQRYRQEQSEKGQEGLQGPGGGSKGLWSTGSFFHQSSWSDKRDLKGPVESGKSTNEYRTGATVKGSAAWTAGITFDTWSTGG